MSNKRMVSSDTWRDEFFSRQDWFGRLLWVGMITVCADDQGRFINSARLIGVDVFPMDDAVTTEQVAAKIKEFADAGRVLLYDVGDKHLIQIINWWKHQAPSWAAASVLPAPMGWTDRVKVHVKGGKVLIVNWDKRGGFGEQDKQLHSQLGSKLDRPINEYEDEYEMREGRDEYEDEKGGGAAAQRESAPEIHTPTSPIQSGAEAWESIKRLVEPDNNGEKFRYRAKVDPCEVIEQRDQTLRIRAPNSRTCAWLTGVFATRSYQVTVAHVLGEGGGVEFIT